MKKTILISAMALAMALVFSVAYALAPSQTGIGVNTLLYHSYDGMICADCHTMHNSEGGLPMRVDGGGATPVAQLLKRASNTDICLSCHKQGQNTSATDVIGAYDGSGWSAPIVMTTGGAYAKDLGYAMPGGDFYHSNASAGKGHNPYKSKAGDSTMMIADSILGVTPPGGTLATATTQWDCNSCHGTHSRFSDSYTAWRQLKREVNTIVHTGDVRSYGVESLAGNKTQNTAYEPILSNSRGDIRGGTNDTNYENTRADGQPLEGADLWANESASNHNVYRGGFSSFCSVCHGGFHGGTEGGGGGTVTSSTGNTATGTSKNWIRHPTNVAFTDAGGEKYNASMYTKAVTNAQNTNPNPSGYDYKYPLIRVSGTWTTTTTGSVINGDKITCLSCHYAHASRFDNALRWDAKTKTAFIGNGQTDGYGYVSTGDNPVYGCNKCHQKGGAKAYVKDF